MQAEMLQRAFLNTFEDDIARIVDEDIEPAVALLHRINHMLPLIRIGNVQFVGIAMDFMRHFVRQIDLTIGHDYMRAFFGKAQTIGLSQPHRASGYQRHLPCDSACHPALPTLFSARQTIGSDCAHHCQKRLVFDQSVSRATGLAR